MNVQKPVSNWLYSHTDFYMDGRIINYSGPSEYLPNRFQLFENFDEHEISPMGIDGIYNSVHKHENLEMIYLRSGSIDKIYINGQIYSMEAGDLAIADSGSYHGIIERRNACMITMIYDMDFIKSMEIDIENLCFTPIVKSSELNFISDKIYKEMKRTPLYYYINIQNMAKELIIKLVRSFSATKTHASFAQNPEIYLVKKIAKYLQTEYAENITLEKIARYTNYSQSYISRVFKQVTGRTLWFHLNYIRCQHAKWLLKTTNFPVEAVSKKCGFGSEGYLTRVFKTYTGFTPSQIREASVNADRK